MLIDATQLDSSNVLDTDICIVGAGPAGVTLAIELGKSGVQIILVECGGEMARNDEVDRFKGEAKPRNIHPPLNMYRRTGIGGTTAVWGGRCVPYDPIDFEARDYMAESGWPISYESIARYYGRATQLCEAGENAYSVRETFGDSALPMLAGFHGTSINMDGIERFSCPTHFGRRYGQDLRNANNIRVLHHATCTSVNLSDTGTRVVSVTLRVSHGKEFQIKARHYVLALGGMETTRLLLASNDIQKNGIGNDGDKLGRFYMCHLVAFAGLLKMRSPESSVIFGYEQSKEGVYCRRRIGVTAEAQRANAMGNIIARPHYASAWDPKHGNAILSMLFLSKVLLQPEYRVAFGGNPLTNANVRSRVSAHLGNVLRDIPGVVKLANDVIWKRFLAHRKLPSVMLRSANNEYPLDFNVEQTPLSTSRISLMSGRDEYGVPRLSVDWQYSPFDAQTVVKFLRLFQQELVASGCGTLSFDEDKLDFAPVGGHHIGTTRMARSYREGVVDENAKVFGVENLYVCSSSVFPTSSHANPTLTIVAMALRLAEHLSQAADSRN